jgi:hypothetical protein
VWNDAILMSQSPQIPVVVVWIARWYDASVFSLSSNLIKDLRRIERRYPYSYFSFDDDDDDADLDVSTGNSHDLLLLMMMWMRSPYYQQQHHHHRRLVLVLVFVAVLGVGEVHSHIR